MCYRTPPKNSDMIWKRGQHRHNKDRTGNFQDLYNPVSEYYKLLCSDPLLKLDFLDHISCLTICTWGNSTRQTAGQHGCFLYECPHILHNLRGMMAGQTQPPLRRWRGLHWFNVTLNIIVPNLNCFCYTAIIWQGGGATMAPRSQHDRKMMWLTFL